MILRRVIREKIIDYLTGREWTEAVKSMAKGREEVFHAHIYADSILHPLSLRRIMEDYFTVQERPVERTVKLLSHGKGFLNIYYIQPAGMCHFEVFLKYTPDVVIEPMSGKSSRSGKAYEYWGPEYMRAHHGKFPFRQMDEAAREEVERYFRSPSWESIYRVMAFDNERNVHSHCIVETSVHPEQILAVGAAEIERKGWDLDRAVPIVFGLNGFDQGKITYLVRSPELVLELEWEFNPDTVIKAKTDYPARITTTEMVENDMAGIDYVVLEEDDFVWIRDRVKKII